jgi:hypothetical protein
MFDLSEFFLASQTPSHVWTIDFVGLLILIDFGAL